MKRLGPLFAFRTDFTNMAVMLPDKLGNQTHSRRVFLYSGAHMSTWKSPKEGGLPLCMLSKRAILREKKNHDIYFLAEILNMVKYYLLLLVYNL